MPIADRHDRGHRIAAFRIPTGSRYDHEHHDRDPYSCRHPRDRATPAEEAAYLEREVQSAMGMSVAEFVKAYLAGELEDGDVAVDEMVGLLRIGQNGNKAAA